MNLSPEELAEWADCSEDKDRLEKVCRLDRIWDSLFASVTKVCGPRPALSAVAADQYDGEDLRISEWIAQGSPPAHKRWDRCGFRIVLSQARILLSDDDVLDPKGWNAQRRVQDPPPQFHAQQVVPDAEARRQVLKCLAVGAPIVELQRRNLDQVESR